MTKKSQSRRDKDAVKNMEVEIRKLSKEDREKKCASIIEGALVEYNCSLTSMPAFIPDPYGGFRIGVRPPTIAAKDWEEVPEGKQKAAPDDEVAALRKRVKELERKVPAPVDPEVPEVATEDSQQH